MYINRSISQVSPKVRDVMMGGSLVATEDEDTDGPLRMQLQLSPASCQHHQYSLQSPPVVINRARQEGCDGGGGCGMDYTTLH